VNRNLFGVTLAIGALGVLGAAASACLGGSSPGAGGGNDGGTSSSGSGSSSGSSSGGGSSGSSSGSSSGGGSSGSSSGGSSGGADAGGCTTVALTPSPTGYVSTTALNIAGAWFAYGDDLGANGAPPGQCVTTGMHPAADCSAITSPAPAGDGGTASFPQTTPGTMCLSGTAAQVIGTPPDYSNIFGIGIGLDFNNPTGTPLPYDAAMNQITGFQFTVAGLPTGAVRVEFAEPATDTTGDAWSYTLTSDGQVTVNLASGTGAGDLSPSFTPTGTQPAFDPTKVESIQFHVVTNTSGAVAVSNFCISDLQAIVCP
jgi:hypothetical protein